MEKTIKTALHLFIISGLLFTACSGGERPYGEDGIGPEDVEQPEVNGGGMDADMGMPAEGSDVEDTAVTQEDSDSAYVDGTYTKTGSYVSPAGPETVGVTLTIEGDLVTAVSIETYSSNDVSQKLQDMFAEGIGAKVTGVSLDEIGEFSSVNGSSLTPKGFQDALEQIKAEAQA